MLLIVTMNSNGCQADGFAMLLMAFRSLLTSFWFGIVPTVSLSVEWQYILYSIFIFIGIFNI